MKRFIISVFCTTLFFATLGAWGLPVLQFSGAERPALMSALLAEGERALLRHRRRLIHTAVSPGLRDP